MQLWQIALIIYTALINISAFILCIYDKRAAKRGRWRIPEKTLFGVSILGGAAGLFSAMLLVRHKTRHLSFMLLIPLLAAGHIALFIYLLVQTV